MNRSLIIRAFALLLALVLATTPVIAAGSQGTRSGEREPGLFASLMELLGSLVPALGAAQGTMDPDGAPLPDSSPTPDLSSSSPAEGDAQGTMDPDGSS